MHINRKEGKKQLRSMMKLFPVTAIVGARQCGKTTLARELSAAHAR